MLILFRVDGTRNVWDEVTLYREQKKRKVPKNLPLSYNEKLCAANIEHSNNL